MEQSVQIISYFSLPTDLAAEMRYWPEFVAGQDYSVDFRCPDSGETVAVRFVEHDDERYVSVAGSGPTSLFDRVLGRVIYALSAHSDVVMVGRHIA